MRRLILIALPLILSAISPSGSQAHLFERPAGAEFDLYVCTANSELPNLVESCSALGLFECNGKIEANGFLVRVEGSRDVIVTSSHTFIDEETRSVHRDCRFLPQGKEPGLAIRSAIILSPDIYDSSRSPDLAAVQLMKSFPSAAWRIPMKPISASELPSLLSRASVRFAILSIDPWQIKAVFSAYRCSPVPKMPGHLNYENPSLLNHNCPTDKGYSGSPGLMFDSSAKRAVALCVHSGDFGPDDRKPFDPARNVNSCDLIAPDFIALVNLWSRGEPVEAPEGGILVDYTKVPAQ